MGTRDSRSPVKNGINLLGLVDEWIDQALKEKNGEESPKR